MPTTRKKNPGLFRTRKAAILDAIERIEADPSGSFYKEAFVVGSARRWGMVTRRPTTSMAIGPIRIDNVDKYRRWYC
jgi:hypothetical protein